MHGERLCYSILLVVPSLGEATTWFLDTIGFDLAETLRLHVLDESGRDFISKGFASICYRRDTPLLCLA